MIGRLSGVTLIVVAFTGGWQRHATLAATTPDQRAPAVGTPAPRGTAIIRGYVVAADTGRPLRRVTVTASTGSTGAAAPGVTTTTDLDGRFSLTRLQPGRFEISASRDGYLTVKYGQRHVLAPGTPIDVATGQTIDDISIALPRTAGITGRVTDEFGEPFPGVNVNVLGYQFHDGRRRLVPVSIAHYQQTDDFGEYRVRGLTPGQYYVVARTTRAARGSSGAALADAAYTTVVLNGEDGGRIVLTDNRPGDESSCGTRSSERAVGEPRGCARLPIVDFDRLRAILRALEQAGVQYAIFGAMALNVHGLARFTEDLDLFVAPTVENIELKDRADAELIRRRFGLKGD